MTTAFEDLKVLQAAERLSDEIWELVAGWQAFSRDTVGSQIVRASDSVGANIAEAFGRYHYGEKINYLYYARGSLFETKYWLNRCLKRNLMKAEEARKCSEALTAIARQLNSFIQSLKTQRSEQRSPSNSLREAAPPYLTDDADVIFSATDLTWLQFSNL